MSSTKPSHCYAVIDCDHFFVACERVFNPRLQKLPVVVLSGNDGCVIARSPEAKKLGIPMGAPAFSCKETFERGKVVTLSSNFTLYGDLSKRVMSYLRGLGFEMQVYSIDEAFLLLPQEGILERCEEIREKIKQWIGLPISIGVSSTKTLAKIAVDLAKKGTGVCILNHSDQIEKILRTLPTIDVWGIGENTAERLKRHGIFTAHQLKEKSDAWIKKELSVVGLRTALELRGEPCLTLQEEPVPNKSIMFSRSFGKRLTEFEEIAEALSSYVAGAVEELRSQDLVASGLEVFLLTSPHEPTGYYANKEIVAFPEPTSYTPTLITCAKKALRTIFLPGLSYKKVGVVLFGLVPAKNYQQDLFTSNPSREKQEKLMQTVDILKEQWGDRSVKFAAEGLTQGWKMRKENVSQKFTTSWKELLTII